jgi:hypothetical protein
VPHQQDSVIRQRLQVVPAPAAHGRRAARPARTAARMRCPTTLATAAAASGTGMDACPLEGSAAKPTCNGASRRRIGVQGPGERCAASARHDPKVCRDPDASAPLEAPKVFARGAATPRREFVPTKNEPQKLRNEILLCMLGCLRGERRRGCLGRGRQSVCCNNFEDLGLKHPY